MSDFRGKTCGECAWMNDSNCRRVSWGEIPQFCLGPEGAWTEPGYFGAVSSYAPACPAFVPKEKPEPAKYGPLPHLNRDDLHKQMVDATREYYKPQDPTT